MYTVSCKASYIRCLSVTVLFLPIEGPQVSSFSAWTDPCQTLSCTNTVIFWTILVSFRTKPVTCVTYSIILGTCPVIFRRNTVT